MRCRLMAVLASRVWAEDCGSIMVFLPEVSGLYTALVPDSNSTSRGQQVVSRRLRPGVQARMPLSSSRGSHSTFGTPHCARSDVLAPTFAQA